MRVFKGVIRDPVDLLAFGPGERLAAATAGRGKLDVWDSVTGFQADAWRATDPGERFQRQELPVTEIGFLPDGRVMGCVGGQPLQVFDPDGEGKGAVFADGAAGLNLGPAVRFATAGDAVFSTHARNPASPTFPPTLVCWRPTAIGAYSVAWSGLVGSVPHAVAASPDGRLVATAGAMPVPGGTRQNSFITIWDAATGKALRQVVAKVLPWGLRDRLRFTPDGSRVVAVRDDSVNLWDSATCEYVGRLTAPDRGDALTDAVVHPSGRWLLTSGIDGKVRVWDAERLEVVNVFEWTVGKLRSVAVGGDGAVAAAGGNDGNLVVWDLDL